jgi:hypothetical protein
VAEDEIVNDPNLANFLLARTTSGIILAHQMPAVVSEATNRFPYSEDQVKKVIKGLNLDSIETKTNSVSSDKGFVSPPEFKRFSPGVFPKTRETSEPARIPNLILKPPTKTNSDDEDFFNEKKGEKTEMSLINLKGKGFGPTELGRIGVLTRFMRSESLDFLDEGKRDEALSALKKAGLGGDMTTIYGIRNHLKKVGIKRSDRIDTASFEANGDGDERSIRKFSKMRTAKNILPIAPSEKLGEAAGNFLVAEITAVENKIAELEQLKELLVAAQEKAAGIKL